MASYSFPWSDGSSDIIEVLVGDGLVGDISVSCVGHSLRSDCRRRTLTLTNADGMSVHIMVSQFHDSVLSMVFRIGGGDSVSVDSDSSEVVIPLTGSVTITSFVSDGQGGVVAKDVSWPLGSSTYGSLFSITHSGSLGSLVRLEPTSGAVNVVVGKNVDGIFGNESFVCRFTGYGFDEESAPVGLVLETNLYDITGIRLLCSTDGVSWASSASLLSSGGLVYFQYELLRSFRDGRSDSYVVGVGSSELGGSLFVGNAEYPYSDRVYRSYWSSYRFNPNIEPADLTQPVRWTFMGFSSSVSVTLEGAIVVVDSWLELSMSPVWCDASGISGSFTALKYERLSDSEGTVRLAQDFTSVAVLDSSGSWLSGSGGSFVVSAYTGRDGDRSVGVTVTAGGLTSEVVYFTQERLMTDEYYAPVVSFSYPVISSDGGSVSPVISSIQQEWLRGATNTREVLSLSLSDLSSVVWSVSGVGATIDSSTGVVVWANNTVTESRSVVVSVSCVSNGVSGGGRASSVQEAYVPISYGVPEGLVLSVGDIPASGGSVSSGVLSGVITQTMTQGSVVETLSYSVSDISGSYSAAVSAGSLGEVESARSKVGTLVYSFVLNGVTGYAEADVYQEANVASYGAVSISGGSVGDIPAGGGTVSAAGCSASQTVSYTSGSTRAGSVSLSYSSVSADSLGTTDKSRTKVGVSVCTASGEGDLSATKSFDVYQEANYVSSYSTPSVSLSYAQVGAGGGTATPSLGYSQIATYKSGSDVLLNSGASVSYGGSGVDTTNGTVSVSSKGTDISNATTVTTATVTVSMNGKSSSASASVTQAGNYVTNLSVSQGTHSFSYAQVGAGGGTASPSHSGQCAFTYTFSSGATSSTTPSSTYGSVSDYYVYGGSGVNTTNGTVSVSSKGTDISNATTVTTATVSHVWVWTPSSSYSSQGSKSASHTLSTPVTQAANYVTGVTASNNTRSFSYGTASAAGGSLSPSLSGSESYVLTFSSGSTSSSVPSSTYGSGSWSYSYSGSAEGLFSAPNSSTGVVSVSSKGTTISDVTSGSLVTRYATFTWTPSSSYNGGTKSGSCSLSARPSQARNCFVSVGIRYAGPTGGNLSALSISAAGGHMPDITTVITVSSGAEAEYPDAKYSWFIPAWTYITSAAASGYWVRLSADSRGTVVGDARSGAVSVICTDSLGVSVTGSLTLYQAENVADASSGISRFGDWTGSISTNDDYLVAGADSCTITYGAVYRSNVRQWFYSSGSPGRISIEDELYSGTVYATLSLTSDPSGIGSYCSISSNSYTNSWSTDTALVSKSSYGTTYTGSQTYYVYLRVDSASGTVVASTYFTTQVNGYSDSGGVTTYGDLYGYSTTDGNIPASGGSATSYASTANQDWSTSAVIRTFTSGSSYTVTAASSGTITGIAASPSSFSGSAGSKGTTESSWTKIDYRTCTWSSNGKSASDTLDIWQEPNSASHTNTDCSASISANAYTSSGSPCPASGGSCTLSWSASYRYVYTWSSGSTSYGDWTGATPTISGGDSAFSRSSTTVSIASRGSTTGDIRSATFTASYGNASNSVTIYQQANQADAWSQIVAWGTPSVGWSGGSFTAAGGSRTVSHSVTNTRYWYYTSNAHYRTDYPAGTTSIAIVSNGNNRFSQSGNTISHSGMGTSATTDSVTVRAYNSNDTSKYADISDSVTNSSWTGYSSPSLSVSYSTTSFTADGGTATFSGGTYSYSYRTEYSSGSASGWSSGSTSVAYGSLTKSGSATGFTAYTDGNIAAEANSSSSSRSLTRTFSYSGVAGSASTSVTFTQAGVSYNIYIRPTVSSSADYSDCYVWAFCEYGYFRELFATTVSGTPPFDSDLVLGTATVTDLPSNGWPLAVRFDAYNDLGYQASTFSFSVTAYDASGNVLNFSPTYGDYSTSATIDVNVEFEWGDFDTSQIAKLVFNVSFS